MATGVSSAPSLLAGLWRWRWLVGILLFLSPLLAWPQGAVAPPSAWTATSGDWMAASGAAFASDRGLITLYRWSPAGLQRSVDAGLTWAAVGARLPGSLVGSLLLNDIQAGGARWLYALAGPPARSGLYRSQDNGATFDLIYQPLNFRPTLLAVNTLSPAAQVALAGENSVAITIDGGATWTQGQAPGPVQALAMGERVWVGGAGWLVSSEDGGLAWQMQALPTADLPLRLFIPPRGPAHLYLLAAEGVWRTQDQGASWQALTLPAVTPITALAFDPLVWQTLYVGDARGRVWRSDDWGASWQTLPSPRNGPVRLLFQPPGDRDRLFAASGFELWWITLTPLQPTPTPAVGG